MFPRIELVGGPQDGREVELRFSDTHSYSHSPSDHGRYVEVKGTHFFRWVPDI